jgi:hypothetical protein
MGDAAAPAAAAVGAAAGGGAATPFALTPAAAHSDVLDYTRREHTKIYDAATAPLEGDKFDGTPENLANFLARLREKANNFMWMDSICKIKVSDGPPATFRNLIDDYGNITLSQVRDNATPYVNQQVRSWQNSHQMKVCIFDSLTKDFQNRVNLDKEKWHIGAQAHADGACLLKVVISLSYPDTQATTSHIRTQLTKTDVKIKELNFDIIKFNDWAKEQLAALAARGETTTDLMVNLFKGYEAVPDKEFLTYIASKKSRYEEGKPLTTDELMELAQNKYKNKKQAQTWNTPTEEQEQIIALEARIESLQAQNRALSKRNSNKVNNQGNRNNSRGSNKGRNSGKKQSNNQARNDGDYLNATGKWSWLKVAPKQGDKTTKSHDGKTYHWCTHHARWCRHTSAECKKGQGPKGKKPQSANGNKPNTTLRFAESLEAITEDYEAEQL